MTAGGWAAVTPSGGSARNRMAAELTAPANCAPVSILT
jgi:hypothetical protein